MNNIKAALIVKDHAWGQANMLRMIDRDDSRADVLTEAVEMACNSLRGPVPDPSTGLVPCGCGGKAQVWPSDPTQFTKIITDYEVGCTECAMTTGWVRGKQENAMKVWNTAMGYKEDENE